jgi:hypothetical protein
VSAPWLRGGHLAPLKTPGRCGVQDEWIHRPLPLISYVLDCALALARESQLLCSAPMAPRNAALIIMQPRQAPSADSPAVLQMQVRQQVQQPHPNGLQVRASESGPSAGRQAAHSEAAMQSTEHQHRKM